MKCNKEIADELKAISTILAALDNSMPFSVPENYFESLSDRVKMKISAVNQTLTAPNGYFSKLSDEIMKKIHAEESELAIPVLKELKNTNIFAVPKDYFIGFPDKMIQRIKNYPAETAKIITGNFKARSIWKQAAAAIITGVVAINALWIFNQNNSGSDKVSESTGISSYRTAYNEFRSPEQIDEGLSKISSDDIVKYLASTGNESDNEALITNINENQLPEQDPSQSSDQSIKSYLNN